MFSTTTAWHEMCVQSLILGKTSTGSNPWISTTPAFLTGKCTSAQSTALNSIMQTIFPTNIQTVTNSALNAHAIYGNGTGSFTYTSARNNNYNINLVQNIIAIYSFYYGLAGPCFGFARHYNNFVMLFYMKIKNIFLN